MGPKCVLLDGHLKVSMKVTTVSGHFLIRKEGVTGIAKTTQARLGEAFNNLL